MATRKSVDHDPAIVSEAATRSSPMGLALLPFIVLAALGFILSLWAHLAMLTGSPQPLGSWTVALHPGIFVVGIPSIIVANRLVKGSDPKDYWKITLRGCPAWMRISNVILCIYVGVYFLFFASFPPRVQGQSKPQEDTPAIIRAGSGHWMAFYAMAFSTLYSAAMLSRGKDKTWKNPHPLRDDLDDFA